MRAVLTETLAAKDDYDARLSSHAPEPLNSALIQDCLERGMDATGGGARRLLTGIYGVGLGTAVDALAAVNALVFVQGGDGDGRAAGGAARQFSRLRKAAGLLPPACTKIRQR